MNILQFRTGFVIKSAVIAAGLNKYCSLIPHHIFDMVRKSTNAVEQTHNKSNRCGKQLTLLQAILEYVSNNHL